MRKPVQWMTPCRSSATSWTQHARPGKPRISMASLPAASSRFLSQNAHSHQVVADELLRRPSRG